MEQSVEQARESASQAAPKLIPGKNGVVPPPEHRFQKGRSGNPGGRPKLSEDLRAKLEDAKIRAKVVDALLQRVENGDPRAIELLWDRYEGKLTQRVDSDITQRTIVIEAGMEETPEPDA